MHAYLVVGNNINRVEEEIKKLISKSKTQRLDFNALKIEEVRQLGEFTKLKLPQPTTIVIKNIDMATEEALNAFLKNLEEPQQLLYYILHANTDAYLLPTILSRCTIVYTKGGVREIDNSLFKKFITGTISEKFTTFDKIKSREDAIKFIEDLIIYVQNNLKNRPYISVKLIKIAQKTLYNLKANGNVNLQLSNLAIQYKMLLRD